METKNVKCNYCGNQFKVYKENDICPCCGGINTFIPDNNDIKNVSKPQIHKWFAYDSQGYSYECVECGKIEGYCCEENHREDRHYIGIYPTSNEEEKFVEEITNKILTEEEKEEDLYLCFFKRKGNDTIFAELCNNNESKNY